MILIFSAIERIQMKSLVIRSSEISDYALDEICKEFG